MAGLTSTSSETAVDTDPERLTAAVTGVRNEFINARARRPLKYGRIEQRTAARLTLNVPVRIAAVVMAAGAARLLDGEIAGEALDLSLRGLSFTHDATLPHYFAAITFTLPIGRSVSLLVEILWTHAETKQTYRSGGRFVGVIRNR